MSHRFEGLRHGVKDRVRGTLIVRVMGENVRANIERERDNLTLFPAFEVRIPSRREVVYCDHIDMEGLVLVRYDRMGVLMRNDEPFCVAGIVATDKSTLYGIRQSATFPYNPEAFCAARYCAHPQTSAVWLEDGRVKHVHMNLHVVKRNANRDPEDCEPCVVTKFGGKGFYGYTAMLYSGGSLRYNPERPILSCGARAVMSTTSAVTVLS